MGMSVESVFYEEARKHLAEMFSSNGQNGVSSPRQVSKSLGRILSLPGYNSSSPRFNPGRDEVDSPCLMRSCSLQKIIQSDSTSNFSPSQSIESSSYSDNNLDSGPHAINSSQSLPELQLHTEEDVIHKGSFKTEECESLDISVEFSTYELFYSSERCYEDSGPCEEALPSTPAISASPNSSLTQKLEVPKGTAENLDRLVQYLFSNHFLKI